MAAFDEQPAGDGDGEEPGMQGSSGMPWRQSAANANARWCVLAAERSCRASCSSGAAKNIRGRTLRGDGRPSSPGA
jgi:hypothetical protein